jgi:hypothetical protein
MFDVVRHEIVECEPVVAGHEIDAPFLLPLLCPIDIRAGNKPVWDLVDGPVVASHEAADVITKLPIPFLPGVADETSDLIEAAGVPSLSD